MVKNKNKNSQNRNKTKIRRNKRLQINNNTSNHFLRKRNKFKKEDPNFTNFDFLEDSSYQSIQSLDNSKLNVIQINIVGSLVYRYTLKQIEIIGEWYQGINGNHQDLAYLLENNKGVTFPINKYKIDYSNSNISYSDIDSNFYMINISTVNIIDLLIIKNELLFSQVQSFLSGKYKGYFYDKDKINVDEFNLAYINSNDINKVIGYGNNKKGEFIINGDIKFLRDKQSIIKRNSIKKKLSESNHLKECFILGDIDLKKIYIYN